VESDEGLSTGPPKTETSRRTVAIPPHVHPVVAEHLERFVGPEPDALVFTGSRGGRLRRAAWNRIFRAACRHVGVAPGFRFHDLRHTGNTLAAATGASTRDLMARMGHASMRAAVLYQHASADRDQVIAKALSNLARPAEVVPMEGVSRGDMARGWHTTRLEQRPHKRT
jgi:integrase